MSQSSPFDFSDEPRQPIPQAKQTDAEPRRQKQRTPEPDDRGRSGSESLGNLSMFAGVFSIILCPPFLGPLAIVLGIISLAKKKDYESGHEAVTGIITGTIGVVIAGILFLAILFMNSLPGTVRRF